MGRTAAGKPNAYAYRIEMSIAWSFPTMRARKKTIRDAGRHIPCRILAGVKPDETVVVYVADRSDSCLPIRRSLSVSVEL